MSTFFEIVKKYFIRTVTMVNVGRLKAFNEKELLLESASWIADTGKFHNALKDGTLSDVDPFVTDLIVNREAIIDACEWIHELPSKQI